MKTLSIPEVAAFLLQGDHYVILTHRRPDGDTIGCAAALCGGLRQLGKQAAILENPQFTAKFRPYLDGLTVAELPEDACLVAVDIASCGLMPYNAVELLDRIELAVDHHGRNDGYAKRGYVDAEAAACGELILKLLLDMKVTVTTRIAEALYVAISTDTGCFRYSNTTADTLRAAAYCRDCGADTFAVNQVMFLTRRMARLRLDAYLTETTQFYAGGLVAISAIPNDVRERLQLTEDDIDDISGFGREIAGVGIAAMLKQEGDIGKISVRTSPDYDASAICALLGGGGHRAAAGATVPGGIEGARKAVLDAIAQIGVTL